MKSRALLLLKRRRQQVLWTPPVWTLAIGLGAMLLLAHFGADFISRGWLLAAVALAALLVRLIRRPTLRDVCGALDARTSSRSRFEALAELNERNDPLAHALAADAERFLAEHALPRPYAWLTGLAALSALVVANVVVLRAPLSPLPSAPVVVEATPASATALVDEPEPTPAVAPPTPLASLRWLAPAGDFEAPLQERVRLTAEAVSETELHTLTLHLLIDGQTPAATAVTEHVGPGVQAISTVLPVDALAEPLPLVVAYYLHAERLRPADLPDEPVWPSVVSPLQFVQFPVTEDELALEPAEDDPEAAAVFALRESQQKQRRTMQEAFALHHGLEPESDDRLTPDQVTAQQRALERIIGDLLATLNPAWLSEKGRQALERADTEIRRAADALASGELATAIPFQSRAVTRLREAEISAIEMWRNTQADRAAEDAERLAQLTNSFGEELPDRRKTPAGWLEALAAEQATIAERLAKRDDATDLFAPQDNVARATALLAADKRFPTALSGLLATAAEAARESAEQLNERDNPAATEPAARAAQALAEGVALLNALGRDRATEALLAAQLGFLQAAANVQAASATELAEVARAAAEETKQIQEQLRQAAQLEQQIGSADAAQRLDELARSVSECEICEELGAAGQQGEQRAGEEKQATSAKLNQLAEKAAAEANETGDPKKIQERVAKELKEMKEQLQQPKPSQQQLKQIGQGALANAQRLENRITLPPALGPGASAADLGHYAAELLPRIDGLIELAAARERNAQRIHTLTTGNPAEAPPAYREAVSGYFEALARERAPTAPTRQE